MPIYKIADINVGLLPLYETLKKQAQPYLAPGSEQDIYAVMSDEEIKARQKENPHLTRSECEYIWTGSLFYNQILDFEGFMLHAAAVCYKNQAYLFSAPSGTGKSTHAELWQKCFGYDKVKIINDDKPVIKLESGKFYVCGTPWSGKSNKNCNIKAPLHSICVLHRSVNNEICKTETKNAIYSLLNQTIRPAEPNRLNRLLMLLDALLEAVPIYNLGCNMTEAAARFSYENMQHLLANDRS